MLLFLSLLFVELPPVQHSLFQFRFYVVEHRQPYQSEFLWNFRLFLLVICFIYYSCKYTK